MGWLAPAEGGDGRLWDTSDADEHPAEGHIASYEVSFGYRLPRHEPLPVIPFAACAIDATSRLGKLRLDGADITLPLYAMGDSGDSGSPDGFPRRRAVAALLATARWYESPGATERVPVTYRLTLPATAADADTAISSWLRELQQDVAEFIPARGPTGRAPEAPGITGRCALSGWSAEVIGWTAALLAEAARRHGSADSATLAFRRADTR